MDIPNYYATGAGQVNLLDFYDNIPWDPIIFDFWLDKERTFPAMIEGDWKLKIYIPSKFPEVFMEFSAINDALTYEENELTFKKPDGVTVPSGTYHYFLVNREYPDGEPAQTFITHTGTLTVKKIDLW